MRLRADPTEIERGLHLIVEEGATFEIRALGTKKYGGQETLSGYFRTPKAAAAVVAKMDRDEITGWYVTINPCEPSLYARRADRIAVIGKGDTTGDQHVTRRRRFFIDVDPCRPAGISSTHAEHAAALKIAHVIGSELVAIGWPEPSIADSGNGAHVIFVIDLPADDETLIERVLKATAARWSGNVDGVDLKVDISTYNPSRITKLYGTPARKGDDVAERPHRMSAVVATPEELRTVPRALLEAFAGPRALPSRATSTPRHRTGPGIHAAEWLARHGIGVKTSGPWSGKDGPATMYELEACPYSDEHGERGEAFVIQFASGALHAGCHHDGCKRAGWGWTWLHERFEGPRRPPRADHAPREEREPDPPPPPAEDDRGPPDDDAPPICDDDAPPADGNPVRPGARVLAARYLRERCAHPDGVTLRRWRTDWYRWHLRRGSYVMQTEEKIEAELWSGLPLGTGGELSNVRRSLIAADGVLIDEAELGTWLDSDFLEEADEAATLDTAACRNGLVHLPSGKLTPCTPLYFSTSSISAPYDPSAPTPAQWLAFLHQLWPNDASAIACLQEWIGYLLTPDTRQHKIALLVGPKRCGKGTIGRVITDLLGGKTNVAAPTLASLATNFGRQPLIGKPAAIIGDARLGGRSDQKQAVECLLSISGEDPQTVDRKHREPWNGKLPTRFTILSNELPRFEDASDALPARMLMFQLSESFYGREDITLTGKLRKELPGILGWAIEGWRRLRSRGHFVQPSSGAEALEQLADLGSPVGAWSRERCTVDCTDDAKSYWLTPEDAFADFGRWCDRREQRKPSMHVFGRDVVAATNCPKTRITRKDKSGEERRPWVYKGLTLSADSIAA